MAVHARGLKAPRKGKPWQAPADTLEPHAQIVTAGRQSDEIQDTVARGDAVEQTIEHMEMTAGQSVGDRAHQGIKAERQDRQEVDGRGSRAARHLGGTLEWNWLATPC